MTAPPTGPDLTRISAVLAVALPLHADVVVAPQPDPLAECAGCPPGVLRDAVAVLSSHPLGDGEWLFREPCCLHCLPRRATALADLHPTIEIPAVITL